jgi:hypothetical protein
MDLEPRGAICTSRRTSACVVTGSGSPRENVEKGKADGPIVPNLPARHQHPWVPVFAWPADRILNHHYQPMPRRCSESVSKALQVSANRAAFPVTFSTR